MSGIRDSREAGLRAEQRGVVREPGPAGVQPSATGPGPHAWSLLDLFEMGEAAASLTAAHRTGLLGALLARGDAPEGFAAELGLDRRATSLVLNVLWTYGVVELNAGRFRAAAGLVEIAREHPGIVAVDLDLFEHVADFLRTGSPRMRMDGTAHERGSSFALLSRRLADLFGPAARELARLLVDEMLAAGHPGDPGGDEDHGDPGGDEDHGDPGGDEDHGGRGGRAEPDVCGDRRAGAYQILDLGAGSGVWSMALLESLPAARLTAVDLPPVARLLSEQIAARGLASRTEVLTGSYFSVPLPEGGYDVAILANVLHLEPPAAARRLVGLAARALRPGGVLVIVDALAREPYETARPRAMYALSLALRTGEGRTYSSRVVTGWLSAAGLTRVRQRVITSAPPHIDILTARRPGVGSRARPVIGGNAE